MIELSGLRPEEDIVIEEVGPPAGREVARGPLQPLRAHDADARRQDPAAPSASRLDVQIVEAMFDEVGLLVLEGDAAALAAKVSERSELRVSARDENVQDEGTAGTDRAVLWAWRPACRRFWPSRSRQDRPALAPYAGFAPVLGPAVLSLKRLGRSGARGSGASGSGRVARPSARPRCRSARPPPPSSAIAALAASGDACWRARARCRLGARLAAEDALPARPRARRPCVAPGRCRCGHRGWRARRARTPAALTGAPRCARRMDGPGQPTTAMPAADDAAAPSAPVGLPARPGQRCACPGGGDRLSAALAGLSSLEPERSASRLAVFGAIGAIVVVAIVAVVLLTGALGGDDPDADAPIRIATVGEDPSAGTETTKTTTTERRHPGRRARARQLHGRGAQRHHGPGLARGVANGLQTTGSRSAT